MYHARQRCMPTRNQAPAHLHIDVRGRSNEETGTGTSRLEPRYGVIWQIQATPSSFPGRWLRLSAASVKRQGMLSAGIGVVECLEFRVRLDRACQLPQSLPTVHSLSTHLPQNRPACPKIDPRFWGATKHCAEGPRAPKNLGTVDCQLPTCESFFVTTLMPIS
jgi:hypothetical protein